MVSLFVDLGPNTPKEIWNWRIWTLAIIASFASVMIGYDSAFVGGTIVLPSFIADFGTLDPNTSANLVTTYQIGAIFGSFMGYPLTFYAGRRWGLLAAAVLFTIGSIVMTIASPSTGLGPIYGGRAVAGLAIGAASNITPLYIAEIAPASFRGALVGMYELGWQAGGLVGFFINYGVSVNMAPSTTQWRIPFGVQLIPGGLFCITAPFLIESPRWLLTKGNRELALKNLATIRHLPEDHAFLLDELDMMQRGVEAEQKEVGTDLVGPLRQLFSKGIRYRLFLAVMLFMFQNGTAINAINYYSPTIIKSFGINSLNAGLLSTGIFGVIKTLGAAVWLLFLIDRVGRRNIFLVGAVGTALSLWWIAIYLAVAPPSSFSSGDLTPGSKSMLAAFYIWTAFYGTTWNGTPWVFGSEAFPIGSRAAGQAFVACANWAWNLLISRTTPNAFASIGSKFYFVFAGVTTLAIPFVFFLLPETRHIPLERVGELFDSDAGVPVWKRGEVVRKRLLEAEIVVDVKRADGEKGEFHVAM